jgi:hypothetical protein
MNTSTHAAIKHLLAQDKRRISAFHPGFGEQSCPGMLPLRYAGRVLGWYCPSERPGG